MVPVCRSSSITLGGHKGWGQRHRDMFGITEVGKDDPLAAQKEMVRRKKRQKGYGSAPYWHPPRTRQHAKAYSETWVYEAVKAPELCTIALFVR